MTDDLKLSRDLHMMITVKDNFSVKGKLYDTLVICDGYPLW